MTEVPSLKKGGRGDFKPLLGIQFYRQKPIGEHIVDFFAPRAKLVVAVDGSQHLRGDHALKDRSRDRYLVSHGLQVVRLNSREVLEESDAVVWWRLSIGPVPNSCVQKSPLAPL